MWGSGNALGRNLPDLDSRLAADTGVDLIEDEGRHGVEAREDDLEGEHHPRTFSAGCTARERSPLRCLTRDQQKLDVVDAVAICRVRRTVDGEATAHARTA